MTAPPTPSQTIGPFFRFGMARMAGRDLVSPASPGAVLIAGRVTDGDGEAVPDAMLEIYQADAFGGWPPSWLGFGRALSDDEGRYGFVTVKPGPVDERQAPHIEVSIFARGLLQRLMTRIYFPDEPEANAADPLLSAISDAQSADTLVAMVAVPGLRFDIRLQGPGETVFLAW